MMIRKLLVSTLAVAALAPGGLVAQATSDAAVRSERAEILSEQGWLLANQARDFERAASYVLEAARLRDDCPAKVRDLLNAGRFHFYSHHPLMAVSAFKAAGEVAAQIGDVTTARQAFHDAAWVAAEAGDVITARELLGRTTTS